MFNDSMFFSSFCFTISAALMERFIEACQLVFDSVHLCFFYLVELRFQRHQYLLSFSIVLLSKNLLVLLKLFINKFILLPHLDAEKNKLNSVDVDRGNLSTVCHQQPGELLESINKALLLFTDVVDELADATLDFGVGLHAAL